MLKMQNKGLFQGGTSQCLWAEVFGLPAISCLACCTYLEKTLHAQALLGSLQVLLGSHPSHQDRTAGTLQVRAVCAQCSPLPKEHSVLGWQTSVNVSKIICFFTKKRAKNILQHNFPENHKQVTLRACSLLSFTCHVFCSCLLAEHVLCQELLWSFQSCRTASFQIPFSIQSLSKPDFRASLSSPRSRGSGGAAALCF